MRVGHLGSTIHRNMAEGNKAFSPDFKMFGGNDSFLAVAAGMGSGGFKGHVRIGLTVKEPERHVNTLDLLQVVFVREFLRQ